MRLDQFESTGNTIVLDIDGTLAPAGSLAVPAWVIQAVSRLKETNTVYLFSNKNLPERNMRVSMLLGVPLIDSPYAKPNPKVLATMPAGTLVVGDKYLTDGLLAYFTGNEFIKVERLTAPDEPWADKLLSAVDDVVGAMWSLFRLMRAEHWAWYLAVFVPFIISPKLFTQPYFAIAAAVFGALCFFGSGISVLRERHTMVGPWRQTVTLFGAALLLAGIGWLVLIRTVL